MLKLLLLISISSLAAGFVLGYAVRAGISHRRRRQAEQRRMVRGGIYELPRALREALTELSRRSRRQGQHRRGVPNRNTLRRG